MITTTDSLAYYTAHGAALFPIPAGSKAPGPASFWSVDGGQHAASFKHDHSRDPAIWQRWRTEHPGCNFGVVAFASGWIILDIDTSPKEGIEDPIAAADAGRAEAWQLWSDLCTSWGLPGPLAPHVQSARGGWHAYFSLPPHVDPATLRQPDAIKARINVRCIGYVVAAGSYYDGTAKGEQSGHYVLFPDTAPPHPCPPALLEHCTRIERTISATPPGSRDKGDVAALLTWLAERDAFADYESWFQIGMALRLEYGDDGFDLWQLTFNDDPRTPIDAATKWASFSTEPNAQSVTLNSFLSKAHSLGWRGSVRTSAKRMFDGVAQLAAAAGASLFSGMPTPSGSAAPSSTGVPMMAGQEVLCDLATPILQDFLAATADAPSSPLSTDYPILPPAMVGHGLYSLLNDAITRIVALADDAKKWKSSRVTRALAVLSVTHQDVFESLCRRLEASGRTINSVKIKLAATSLADGVQRVFVKQDDWIYDAKSGMPESDNPDNVATFLGILSAELRWNGWLNRAEIQGFEWQTWQAVDDVVIAKLTTRAFRTGTRFRVADGFLKQTLLALAHLNQYDPVVDRLAALQWDGTPRLCVWLSATCGVPCDPYHQSVGKNVIGGMVKRARHPGAKHDEVMILIGPQGTMKSTMCRTLALCDDWFTDSVSFEGSPQNIIPQLFGKLVVELSELDGMAKQEVKHVKAFITRQSDNVTLKYKAFASDFARRCIFIGTSNEDNPLVDMTGNRRFLPVRVPAEINMTWLRANVEQLVAEACAMEARGADFSIPREVWGLAGQHQEAARSVSDTEERLTEWFGATQFTANAFITKADLVELCEFAAWKNIHQLRGMVMKRLGFHEAVPYIGGIKTKVWLRSDQVMLPKHIEKQCVRYMVSRTSDHRPRVTPRAAPPSP